MINSTMWICSAGINPKFQCQMAKFYSTFINSIYQSHSNSFSLNKINGLIGLKTTKDGIIKWSSRNACARLILFYLLNVNIMVI